MSITYYKEVKADKDYPFAKEVTDYLFREYGLVSGTNKPAATLVRVWLNFFHEGEDKLYYETCHGLARVYPHAKQAVIALLEELKSNGPERAIKISGKNYSYKLRKDCFFES